jgi:biotin transport system substrate-specific component
MKNPDYLTTNSRATTLAAFATPQRFADDRFMVLLTKLFLIVAGSAMIGLSAQLEVPWYPVPVTGQTLMILLIGMAYGPALGAATVIAYLFEGGMGLPVFSGGAAGWPVIAGFTGGYLVGFVPAAALVGYLATRGLGRTILGTVMAMIAGNLVIYAFGVTWLQGFIGIEKAIAGGLMPFIYGDLLKIVIAAALMPAAWRAVQKFQGKQGK